MAKLSNKEWRKKFDKIMEYCGEFIIVVMSTKDIRARFEHQGFWSGVYVRIYEKNGEFTYQEKKYGGA